MKRSSVPAVLLAIAAAAAAAAEPGAAAAADEGLCPLTDGADNCVRVLACVGDAGAWFHGRAFGRGHGRLVGQMNDGTPCTGSWTSSNALGLGQASVRCDDGMTATAFFTYQEPYTGTAIGRGLTSDGRGVKVWSGLNVLDYLERETGKLLVLPCGGGADTEGIPIS